MTATLNYNFQTHEFIKNIVYSLKENEFYYTMCSIKQPDKTGREMQYTSV